MGSSRTRDWTHIPCIGRRILNHCTTREALTIYFKTNQTAPEPTDGRPEWNWQRMVNRYQTEWAQPPMLKGEVTKMDVCTCKTDLYQTATVEVQRVVRPHSSEELWRLWLQGELTQTEAIPLTFSPVLCLRQPNLILLTGSWGYSKELPDSPSGPGIPFYVILADWKPLKLSNESVSKATVKQP